MGGYAVVDVETTGLFPGGRDRVVEVAVVHVDGHGEIERRWTTLLNPGRDLGPQHVHRVSAAQVLGAPTFAQVAGHLAELLSGRVFVAHNASFDRRFISAEYAALGWDVPLSEATSLCTMRWAGVLLPGSPRTLAGCCAGAGIPLEGAHAALADATATAALLRRYLIETGLPRRTGTPRTGPTSARVRPVWEAPWAEAMRAAARARWPPIPVQPFEPALRDSAPAPTPFLTRLTDRLPRTAGPLQHQQYLSVLDRALLDRVISVREQDALVSVAVELDIDRATGTELHRGYLRCLAAAAWADGEITAAERADLDAVAAMLGLDTQDVDHALADATPGTEGASPSAPITRFALRRGDTVVFTGDLARSRSEWIARTRAAGLVVHPTVTRKVTLVVAADPDSLSGKARKAADYGIPIVTEPAFVAMLARVGTRPATRPGDHPPPLHADE